MSLKFSFRHKDLELRACPKHLVHFNGDEPNTTIALDKWFIDERNGRDYKITLAYFQRKSEGYYLIFVSDRPFTEIDPKDVPIIWEKLKEAQEVLDRFFEDEMEDYIYYER